MSMLAPADLAVVSSLLGEDLAGLDSPAIAASIADLRGALPDFRRACAELLGEEGAGG